MKLTTRHLIVATLCFGTLSAFAATTTTEESSDIANKETPQQVDQAKSATDKSDDQMKSKKTHRKNKMHKEANDNSMNNKPIGTTSDDSTVNPNDAVNGKKY
ncbi:MAG TPA: hypothetical protein VGC12_02040 [Methyloradius sp.]